MSNLKQSDLKGSTHDELGRLNTKYRHNSTDTISNEYNIRNWVTRIKNGEFNQNIYYNTNLPEGAMPSFNGNISATSWTYNNIKHCYRYSYDQLNRIISSVLNNDLNYEETSGYDKHGNITYLFRTGRDGYTTDLLTFNYDGNQIRKISDEYGTQNKYNVKEYNDLANQTTEFFYDANGNMIADLDREIVTIKYNLLNLPDTVQFRNGNQIINCYAADGTKLRTDYFTLVTPLAVPITQGEIRKLEYQTDVVNQDTRMFTDNYEYTFYRDPDPETHCDYYSLSRIGNSEGYANFGANPRVYYYYYRKDHLGNNREVCRAHDKKVVQRTQYYPSGLPWGESEGANVQSYKYNGKEFIEMHGYDTYDYGLRDYYSAIQRFTSIDPLAEKYYSISPYAYCANNPVRYIDPTGMDWVEDKNHNIIWRNNVTSENYKNEGVLGEGEIYRGTSYERIAEWKNISVNGQTVNNIVLEKYGEDRNLKYAEMTDASISIDGSMREGNDNMGDVDVIITLTFNNGEKKYMSQIYSAVAGGFGNGAPENGNYTVDNYQDRSLSGWYNAGMNRDGVGFSFNLNPQFDTERSLLRIHPDGNNEGTLGCIGLSGNAAQLDSFRNNLNLVLKYQNLFIPATVNIFNNPNHNGRRGRRISNVNE